MVSVQSDTAEMEELLRSLGGRIVDRVVQERNRPDPRTFLGLGRIRQLHERLRQQEGNPSASGARPLVVVDAALKPPQLFGIEDIVKAEVWDRIRVILEIFQQQAQVKEARLQVELARLRYELPFVHEALHRTLTGEHPGFMGGGELPMRTYETQLRRRTRKILEELASVRLERAQRRRGRHRSGFQLVSITGYTNSGKSSLLNALCGSDVHVENVYFSTLQTTTRRPRPEHLEGRHAALLFTDTVGFIRNLPPWLVDAFASTLEEVSASDAIVLVVDASEPVALVRPKLQTAWSLLDQLGAPKRRVLVLNKADLVSSNLRSDIQTSLSLPTQFPTTPFLWISTFTNENVSALVRTILNRLLPSQEVEVHLSLQNPHHQSFASWLREHTDVLEQRNGGDGPILIVRCTRQELPHLLRRGRQASARLEEPSSTRKEGDGGSPSPT